MSPGSTSTRSPRAKSCAGLLDQILASWLASTLAMVSLRVRRRVSAWALPRPLRHRFGEIGEQHGEPEPQIDLEGEAPTLMR